MGVPFMADDSRRQPAERRIRREDRPEQLHWIAQARCLAATLDLLAQPIMLLVPGTPLRVWHANAAARSHFTAESIVRIRDGRLLFAEDAHDRQWRQAMQRARSLGPAHPQTIELAGRDGRMAATLQVQALDFGASPDLPVSEVVMLEVHERAPVERGLQRLCEAYLLTRKEAECAVGLYAMGSLDEFARCAGKSIHTVRSQLKAAMQKTSTHTQAGLVALVAEHLGA
jgi:DNA-binding CsgD family transcriptional regulator